MKIGKIILFIVVLLVCKIAVAEQYKVGRNPYVTGDYGYKFSREIKSYDSHYGMEIGHFYVTGYTNTTKDTDGVIVFLKNVNDKIRFHYVLNQNILELKGNKNLFINDEDRNYDEMFKTGYFKMGKGCLITQYTNYQNVTEEPKIYSNFLLQANNKENKDLYIAPYEEGDYHFKLDYTIRSKGMLVDDCDEYSQTGEFKVRNGDCIAFLFDVNTLTELVNGSTTKNGFKIDFAKSRYLRITVKKEIMNQTKSGLNEDTRFNRPAKDGEEYKEEGVYTVTAYNRYTDQTTIKKVYVGDNPVLKVHAKTGMSIYEINAKVKQGYTINNDGTMSEPPPSPKIEEPHNEKKAEKEKDVDTILELSVEMIGAIILATIGIVLTIYNLIKMRKS